MVIYWAESAVINMEQILLYLKMEKMEYLAANTEAKIKRAVEKLLIFPNIGRVGKIVGTRELVLSTMPFVIVYQVKKNIEILNVLHTSRYFSTYEEDNFKEFL